MCKNPELAIRLIDYMYSEEGINLVNYGVEGESYNLVDGKPVYTDEVLNNPNGLTLGQALSQYARPYNNYNSVQLYEAYEQTLTTDDMKNAVKVWAEQNGGEHVVLSLTPTEDEQIKLAEISNAIETYCEEMFIKFVTGTESLDNFDEYKKNLEKLGVKDFIKIKQAAYDRMNNR